MPCISYNSQPASRFEIIVTYIQPEDLRKIPALFLWQKISSIRRKIPNCTTRERILHHDNAPSHTSHLVQQFLAKHGTAELQQPPYSPDLAPCDFFLFPRLNKVLKGHRFEATQDIKRNSTKTLLDILKEEFAKCFQQWQKRWAKCVAAEGNYVEDN